MELSVTEHTIRILTVAVKDRLDAFSAPDLRARLEGYAADGVSRFVLDLSAVSFMDSAGMAVLVSVLKRARQAGGDVKLVWPESEAARRILRLTRFDQVFDHAETAAAALQSFWEK